MNKFSIGLLATMVAASVLAQEPKQEPQVVGKLADVSGLVTVTFGDKLTNAEKGGPLIVKSRIVSTSSGSVTLKFDSGCEVTLKGQESITVSDNNNCAALWASVQQYGAGAPVSVAAGTGSSNLIPGLILGAGAIGIIVSNNNKNKTSGS